MQAVKPKAVHREFFENIAKKLTIRNWEDWYKVSFSDIKELGGPTGNDLKSVIS